MDHNTKCNFSPKLDKSCFYNNIVKGITSHFYTKCTESEIQDNAVFSPLKPYRKLVDFM